MKQRFTDSLSIRKLARAALLLFVVLGTLTGCNTVEPNTEEAQPIETLVQVLDFDDESGMLTFDQVEWVTLEDTERIAELDLDADTDFTNGYYIYNEAEKSESLELSDSVEVELVNWDDLQNSLITDQEGLSTRLEQYYGLYHLTIDKDVINKVIEQYTP